MFLEVFSKDARKDNTMKWQIIIYNDGANPYICKTRAEFNRIKKHYNLAKTGTPNFWRIAEKEQQK